MGFRERLIESRKSRGWSQEELAGRLDVSRQTVSKWESGATTPEMAKLIALSELFGLSIDELVGRKPQERKIVLSRGYAYEYTSKRSFHGLPLVHINIGRGLKQARGIIAIGNLATGGVAIGLASCGLVSIGLVSVGLLALATLSLGIVSLGAIAVGLIAAGGVALGYLTFGGVAIGRYALGGAALASHIGMGGYATGKIAIGKEVSGQLEVLISDSFSELSPEVIRRAITEYLPETPKAIVRLFTGSVF